MTKIQDYPSTAEFGPNGVILTDSDNGTKTIGVDNIAYAVFDGIPEMHNKLYRGKNLGSAVTTGHMASITDGSFSGLWTGDYWSVGGNKYRIAHFNYLLGNPHVIVIPDNTLSESSIDSDNLGSKSYRDTDWWRKSYADLVARVDGYLGGNLSSRSGAVINSYSDDGLAQSSDVVLSRMWFPSAENFGCSLSTAHTNGSLYLWTRNSFQRPLALATFGKYIGSNASFILQNRVGSKSFGKMTTDAYPSFSSASATIGIRPLFVMG